MHILAAKGPALEGDGGDFRLDDDDDGVGLSAFSGSMTVGINY